MKPIKTVAPARPRPTAKSAGQIDLGRAPVAASLAADAIEDHIEEAVEDASGVRIDFEALEAEYDKNAALSDESYAMLAKAGIPRSVVDRHIEGRLAAHEKLRAEILEMVGGPERYQQMTDWARAALSTEAFARFEASLKGAPKAVKAMIAELAELYGEAMEKRAAAPLQSLRESALIGFDAAKVDRTRVGAARCSEAPSRQRFDSADQLAKAIRDPRYRSDPAYRAWVAETVAQSDVFGRSESAR